ncbi:MAG: serine/threonine protein kinase [Polyangiaceae bacterium]|nr:serine/threonine protein kinase [Polyangiaceae bacterium]
MTSQGTQRIRDSLIGTTLLGEGGTKFHLRALLGEGGQGWVFKANYDDPDGFWIVVKILRPEGLNRETLERFEKETRVLQMLGGVAAPNPNIVRFYDHGLHKMDLYGASLVVPFIALEYVDGPTLATVLDSAHGNGLPLARTLRVMKQVARALHTVHEHRIVHRDLKPSNIMLATQHGQEVAKVTDFGLVKAPGLSAKNTATIAGATLGYAPPEQYEMGNSRVTAQTDIFSFAAILFETLTGQVAFPHRPGDSPLRTVARMLSGDRPQLGQHLSTLGPELRARPDAIASLDREIARATAADPSARQATLLDLWNAIEPVLRSVTASASDMEDVVATIPQPQRFSAPDHATTTNPDATEGFRVSVRAIPRERLRSAVYAPEEQAIYAVGMNGIYRSQLGSWSRVPLPQAIDVRRVRGVALRRGEVVVFGEAGLAAVVANGAARALPGTDGDFNWLCAFTDDGDCVLAGERRGKPVGIVAEVGAQSGHVHTVAGSTRFHGVTRLASGSLLACGLHGDLAQLTPAGSQQVAWGRTGHLFAVARANNGGAFAVGSGGHALALSLRTAIGPDVRPDLVANLEAVQTTRDLLSVKLGPDGTPWAVGHSARLLRRKAAVWTRVPLEGTTANLIAVYPTERTLSVVAEDGTVLESKID